MALETLELAAERQAAERHVLERKTRLTQDERLALGRVLRRNAACLASLRRFEATGEAADERGRRRLWVWYRRGGAASEGRGRHHVWSAAIERRPRRRRGEQGKWRSASLQAKAARARCGCCLRGRTSTTWTW